MSPIYVQATSKHISDDIEENLFYKCEISIVIFVINRNKNSPDTNATEEEMQKQIESHVSLQNNTFLEHSKEKTQIIDELRNAVLEENVSDRI